LDSSQEDYVIPIIDNRTTNACIGIVKDKPTTTSCRVLTYGLHTVIDIESLVPGKKVFVDIDGTLTTSRPLTGYLQTFGISRGENKVLVNPSYDRVKLLDMV
jgi:hypothetical protein